jgi:hypothetical protein
LVSSSNQLATALDNAQPGDHIVLIDGVYNGSFTLTKAGTATNPIVVKAANKLGATITGSFNFAAAYNYAWGLVFGPNTSMYNWTGNSCKLLRCKFQDGISNNDTSIIQLKGSDCEIAWCEFANPKCRCITVDVAAGARRALIRRNYFHDVYDNGSNFNVAVRVGQSSIEENIAAYCTVEYNLFERYNARYGETVAMKSCSNIVQYNTLLNCDISAIQNRIGHNNQYLANWIEASGGLRVMDRNNTLLGNVVTGGGKFEIFAGNRGPDDPEGSPPKYYPAAWYTIVAGNTGPMMIGMTYSGFTIPAKNTSVEQHNGTITYGLHEGTTVSPTTSWPIPTAFKLTVAQVGPNGS